MLLFVRKSARLTVVAAVCAASAPQASAEIPPSITVQPQSVSVLAGDSATLSAAAVGTDPIQYQWFKGDEPVPAATLPWLSFDLATPADAGPYHLVATNSAGTVKSDTATLTVEVPDPPKITRQPTDATDYVGQNLLIFVQIAGSRVSSQWFKDGTPLENFRSASLLIRDAQKSDSGNYHLVVSNYSGSEVSRTISITVLDHEPPVFVEEPENATVVRGKRLLLEGRAIGTSTTSNPLVYQWLKDGELLAGHTYPFLDIHNVTTAAEGVYVLTATNLAGTAASAPAIVTVAPPPLETLLQLGNGPIRSTFSGVSVGGWLAPEASAYVVRWLRDGIPYDQGGTTVQMNGPIDANSVGEYMAELTTDVGTFTTAPGLLYGSRRFERDTQLDRPEQWYRVQEWNGTIYFLFPGAEEIRRYDLVGRHWLAPFTIGRNPATAMLIDEHGIHLAFLRDLVRYSHEFSGGTTLGSLPPRFAAIRHIAAGETTLATSVVDPWGDETLAYFDRTSGAHLFTLESTFGPIMQLVGTSLGDRCFLTIGLVTSSPLAYQVDPGRGSASLISTDDTFGYVTGELRLSPDGTTLVSTAGPVFDAGTLVRTATIPLPAQDVAFSSEHPGASVVLADRILARLDSNWRMVGRRTLDRIGDRVFLHGDHAFVFRQPDKEGDPIGVEIAPLSDFEPIVQATPVQASDADYCPSAISVDANGVVHLLDRSNRSIHRWSTSERRYLSSWGLAGIPRTQQFIRAWSRVLVGYADGRVNAIDPDSGLETPFASVAGRVDSIVAADDLVVVTSIASTAEGSVFNRDGALLSVAQGMGGFDLVTWSASQRQLHAYYRHELIEVVRFHLSEDGSSLTRLSEVPHPGTSVRPVYSANGDGSLVAAGAGAIVSTADHATIAMLPSTIDAAAWTDQSLLTLRAREGYSELQRWTAPDYGPAGTLRIDGLPLHLESLTGGLWLAITLHDRRPLFHLLSDAFELRYRGTTHTPQPVRLSPARISAQATQPVVLETSIESESDMLLQWQLDGIDVPGANATTLTIPRGQGFHAGIYRLVVRSAHGTSYSEPFSVTIVAAAPSDARLMNISTRGLSLTDSDILIPGFVIEGAGTKRLLIRAVGPTLAAFGVTGTLSDPTMTVMRWNASIPPHGAFEAIASNNDWGTNTNVADIVSAAGTVGAFPLAVGSADAALLVDLAGGRYSVVASGVNETVGVAIVEVYDTDDHMGSSRLVNISNRGFVGTGNDIMIPGFVVSNEGPRTFLIRAVGPTLADFGIEGVLADPMLSIFERLPAIDGQAPIDTLILNNDDWDGIAGSATTASAGAEVGAFPLAAGSKDAAFVVTLSPGIYTVNARGKNGATGVALVEVYLVP